MHMFLTNKTRLKIKDIVKRISIDEQVSLEEIMFTVANKRISILISVVALTLYAAVGCASDDERHRLPGLR